MNPNMCAHPHVDAASSTPLRTLSTLPHQKVFWCSFRSFLLLTGHHQIEYAPPPVCLIEVIRHMERIQSLATRVLSGLKVHTYELRFQRLTAVTECFPTTRRLSTGSRRRHFISAAREALCARAFPRFVYKQRQHCFAVPVEPLCLRIQSQRTPLRN